jgi:hypothetical protein
MDDNEFIQELIKLSLMLWETENKEACKSLINFIITYIAIQEVFKKGVV